MPLATVTTRELKNVETGVDISIPTFKEIPTLFSSTIEYNIVVVSNLRYFKSPKHKSTDTVQFMVVRKWSDFETLHADVAKKFPSTVFPALPRKSILSELSIPERRSGLESFLQFLAKTPKLAVCPIVLQFLGVNALKAGQYSTENREEGNERSDIFEEQRLETGESDKKFISNETDENLFADKQEEDVDLFGLPGATDDDRDVSGDLLGLAAAADKKIKRHTIQEPKLFGDPDFGEGVAVDETDFFVPGARVEEEAMNQNVLFEDEDNSELLNIEDDLDDLLSLKNKKSPDPKPTKPALPSKPTAVKPKIGAKPTLRVKPTLSAKPKTLPLTGQTEIQNIATDDILKYIEDNTNRDDNLDLFS
ncbi:HCLS1-binding protein 3-like [Tubulanus polymorphus]|uniref:HCLS1-binding protein 3-like n=1 Tax=Tubulanus polymorphus TaxID=672921 RepID=UPI003DA49F67